MSAASVVLFLFRRKIGLRQRMVMAQAMSLNEMDGVVRLQKWVLLGSLIIQGTGIAILFLRFLPDFGFRRALIWGVFHGISAFCNAGFDILGNGDSLGAYSSDPIVCITIMLLVVLGGIGFPVWNEFVGRKKGQRFSVYTKFVLILTAVYIVGGAFVVALLEWNNPETLGAMSFGEKILNTFFQSVTWRTAGFITFDNVPLGDGTKLFGCFIMFSGGASASTAGGVKIATIGIIALASYTVAVGRSDINFMRRRISYDSVLRALALVVIQLILTVTATLICISVCDGMGFSAVDLLYEVVSAGATVGLTAGLTPSLPVAAKIVLIFMMYFGRVGILTITFSLLGKAGESKSSISYPDANILIG
jgi:trk system potassium uptake protein TrkH